MINVGFVFYKKSNEPGTLNAKYCHSSIGAGTGIATGGPKEGFEGTYQIRYFDSKGTETAKRGLEIVKCGGYYELSWIMNGEIRSKGVGIEVLKGLAAGWRDILY
jgi:hypothetical protein